jgi:hypothetical protein
MSTSKIKKAMLAEGYKGKHSHLTVVMFDKAHEYVRLVQTTVESLDDCIRALSVDINYNIFADTYLIPAISYAALSLDIIPKEPSTVSYTDVRNHLRHLKYVLEVLRYTQVSIQYLNSARYMTYRKLIGWDTYVGNELYKETALQSMRVTKEVDKLHTATENFIKAYHNQLIELKNCHKKGAM